jgi:hypothetical protein
MNIIAKNQLNMKSWLDQQQELFFTKHKLGSCLLRPPARLVHPYTWVGHIPFARVLIHIMKPHTVVELGTHSGNSFCAFCQAVHQEGLTSSVYAIDTWQGDDNAGYYDESVYKELSQYVERSYGNFATLLRMTFDEALNKFSDGSIDLLHIDGLHTYEAVRHDYEFWKDKLSPQGIVLFHDTQVFERQFGVHRLWSELREEYPGFEFLHSHGLGVLLVGSKISSAVDKFINMATENPDPIQSLFERVSLVWLPDEIMAYQRRYASNANLEQSSLDCELYLDFGDGFNESNKLISHLVLNDRKGTVQFELNRYADRLSSIRFDPDHAPIALNSLAAWGLTKSGKWEELEIITSTAINYNDVMLFGSDPQVQLALPRDRIEVVKIELELRAKGTELVDLLIEHTKKVMDLEIEMAKKEAKEKKLRINLEEYTVMAKKLWNDLAEKDRMLAEHIAEAKKLWNDLAEKDRILEERRQSINDLTADLKKAQSKGGNL